MPTYEYECAECGHQFEEFQSITAKALKMCPACGERTLQRLIGSGAGIIFKGSGFYQTDYRSAEYKKAAKADSDSSSGSKAKSEDKAKSGSQDAPDDKKTAEKKGAGKDGKTASKAEKTSLA